MPEVNNSAPIKILLTGASGYLGQHLLSHWLNGGGVIATGDSTSQGGSDSPSLSRKVIVVAVFRRNAEFAAAIHETLASNDDSSSKNNIEVIPVSCDVTDPSAVDILFQEHDPASLDFCVHTAAQASPRVCQDDPEMARRVNVPEYFFQKLQSIRRLIALSTDQVYDGTKDTLTHGLYHEENDVPRPLNAYAQTKLEMETYLHKLAASGTDTSIAILRSSIILGPKAPISQAHDTFLHFCASRDQQETTFFTNEYRTVVGVQHVCRVINAFMALDDEDAAGPSSSSLSSSASTAAVAVYNMGGPVRVNRYDMAKAVFEHLGYDANFLIEAEQTSSTSPLDISMDSRRLEQLTKIVHEPSTLEGIVESTLQ